VIPVTVIGGYLGAGKTTLLNSLLARSDGRRIGVVVNDFGEMAIDAAIVESSSGVPVANLANGCVCCTLGDDLHSTLTELAAQDPPLDHIVVEASGVADPAATAAWGTVPPFAPGGVVVLAAADSVRRQVDDRYVGGEVRRQLSGADLVVLTKIDLCSDGGAAARLWLTTTFDAPMIESASGDVPIGVVLDADFGVTDPIPHDAAHHGPHHLARYTVWRSTWPDPIDRTSLDSFLAAVPAGVLRMKGIVRLAETDTGRGDQTVLVQVVGSSISVTPMPDAAGTSRLQAIGVRDLVESTELDRLAQSHLTRAPER